MSNCKWKQCKPYLLGKVIYTFDKSIEHGLKVRVGDLVVIKSRTDDWMYGYCALKCTHHSKLGIFPANHVSIVGPSKDTSGNFHQLSWSPNSLSPFNLLSFRNEYKQACYKLKNEDIKQAIMNTMSVFIARWMTKIIDFATQSNYENDYIIQSVMRLVQNVFSEVANCSLISRDELCDMYKNLWLLIKLSNTIDEDVCVPSVSPKLWNRYLLTSCYVNMPLIQLEMLHSDEQKCVNNRIWFPSVCETEIGPTSVLSVTSGVEVLSKRNHLVLTVDNLEYVGVQEPMVLQWCILNQANSIFIYECLWQHMKESKHGWPTWLGEKFVFEDITDHIETQELYLMIFVYRVGNLIQTEPGKQPNTTNLGFRRPIGLASFNIKDLIESTERVGVNFSNLSESDFLRPASELISMKLPSISQAQFHRVIQISPKITNDIVRPSISSSLHTSNECTSPGGCSRIETDRIHWAKSINLRRDKAYEEDRNCVYMKLPSAEFDKANKSTPRNVEAVVSVRDIQNDSKKLCLTSGPSNSKYCFVEEYRTAVTYHSNSPKWRDIIQINLEEIVPEESYICVEFYHCSTNEKYTDARKYFGTCVLKLEEFFEKKKLKQCFTLPTRKIPPEKSVSNHFKSLMTQGNDSDKSLGSNPNIVINHQKDQCKIELTLSSTKIASNKDIIEYLLECHDEENISLVSENLRPFLEATQTIKSEDFLKPFLRKKISKMISKLLLKVCDDNYKESEEYLNDILITEVYLSWSYLAGQFVFFNLNSELAHFDKDGSKINNITIVKCLLNGLYSMLEDCITNKVPYQKLVSSLDNTDIVLKMMEDLILSLKVTNEFQIQSDQITSKLIEILNVTLKFFDTGYYCPESSTSDARDNILRMILKCLPRLYRSYAIHILYDYLDALLSTPNFLNDQVLVEEKINFYSSLLDIKMHHDQKDLLIIWFNPILSLVRQQLSVSSQTSFINQSILLSLNLFKEIRKLTIHSHEERELLFLQKQVITFYSALFNMYLIKYGNEKRKQYGEYSDNESVENSRNQTTILRKIYILLVVYLEEWSLIPPTKFDPIDHYQRLVSNVSGIIEGVELFPIRWKSIRLTVSKIICQVLQKIKSFLVLCGNDEFYINIALVFFDACSKFIMLPHLQLQKMNIDQACTIIEEFDGDMRITVMQCFIETWKNKPIGILDRKFAGQVASIVLGISMVSVLPIQITTFPLLINAVKCWVLCLEDDDCDDSPDTVCRDLISKSELLLREGKADFNNLDSLNKLFQSNIQLNLHVENILDCLRTLVSLHLEYRRLKESASAGATNSVHMQFLLYSFMRFYKDRVAVFPHFQHYNLLLTELLINLDQTFEAASILKQQYDCIFWTVQDFTIFKLDTMKESKTFKSRRKFRKKRLEKSIKENEITDNINLSSNSDSYNTEEQQDDIIARLKYENIIQDKVLEDEDDYNIDYDDDWKYEGDYEDDNDDGNSSSDELQKITLTRQSAEKVRIQSTNSIFLEGYEGLIQPKLKESLAARIIDLLKKADEFEHAADLCRELHTYYLSRHDYRKLSPLLNQWASFYENIFESPRLPLNYYRITFLGGSLPPYMEPHRDYIYKGNCWCKMNNVMDMLKREFPEAIVKIYQANPPLESEFESKDNMAIYVAKLEPEYEKNQLFKNQRKYSDADNRDNSDPTNSISWKVLKFYKDHKVFRFTVDHPFHRGVVDKNNEIKTLHVSRMFVESEKKLPCESVWTPIVNKYRIILTPIEVAVAQITKKNLDVLEAIWQLQEEISVVGKDKKDVDLKPFTLVINGILDAGVNGGIPRYIKAFFTEQSDSGPSCTEEQANNFRRALFEQRVVLRDALSLHKDLVLPEMMPLHERLEICYAELCKIGIELDVKRKTSMSHLHVLELLKRPRDNTNVSLASDDVQIRRVNEYDQPPIIQHHSENQKMILSQQHSGTSGLNQSNSTATGSSSNSIVTWNLDSGSQIDPDTRDSGQTDYTSHLSTDSRADSGMTQASPNFDFSPEILARRRLISSTNGDFSGYRSGTPTREQNEPITHQSTPNITEDPHKLQPIESSNPTPRPSISANKMLPPLNITNQVPESSKLSKSIPQTANIPTSNSSQLLSPQSGTSGTKSPSISKLRTKIFGQKKKN